MSINGPKIYFTIPIFGGIAITQTLVTSFVVTVILCVAGILLGRGLKKRPGKRQVLTEKAVTVITGMVRDAMGEHNVRWTPFIATLFFSCNKLPRTPDTSGGFYRRFVIVPFLADLNAVSAVDGMAFKKRLLSQESVDYVAYKAIKAITEVLNTTKEFTMPEEVKAMLDDLSNLSEKMRETRTLPGDVSLLIGSDVLREHRARIDYGKMEVTLYQTRKKKHV